MERLTGALTPDEVIVKLRETLPQDAWIGGDLHCSHALAAAQFIASVVFLGKLRDNGSPYISHLEDVAAQFPRDINKKTVAWLHDVLEDSIWTKENLEEAGFSGTIINAVIAMTREVKPCGQKEPYFDFIERCGQNEIARDVKTADLENNGVIVRDPLHTKPEKILRYQISYRYLRAIDNGDITPGTHLSRFIANNVALHNDTEVQEIFQRNSTGKWPVLSSTGGNCCTL